LPRGSAPAPDLSRRHGLGDGNSSGAAGRRRLAQRDHHALDRETFLHYVEHPLRQSFQQVEMPARNQFVDAGQHFVIVDGVADLVRPGGRNG